MLYVTLNEEEMALGVKLGTERWLESRKMGLTTTSSSSLDIFGSQGEIACAKALNIEFEGNLNSFKNPDLKYMNIQVRATVYKMGRLIIKRNDDPSHIYILVQSKGGNKFAVVGWIKGKEAKRIGVKETHHGFTCKYVHPSRLNDMSSIVERVNFINTFGKYLRGEI